MEKKTLPVPTTTTSTQHSQESKPFFQKQEEPVVNRTSSFFNPTVQRRANVRPANDPYEKEADQMADIVTSGSSEAAGPVYNKISPLVQRQAEPEEEMQAMPEEEEVQAMEEEESMQMMGEEEEEVQAMEEEEETVQAMEEEEEVQAMEEEEEVQAMEEEEPMQMMEEEEEVQAMEEEEEVQAMEEEEETVQAMEEEEEVQAMEEEEPVQKMEQEEGIQAMGEEEEEVQRRSSTNTQKKAPEDFSTRLKAQKGKGENLPEGVRQEMEDSFGADFSEVKIHRDDTAHQLAKEAHAQAFATGGDIFFKKGKFDATSNKGKHLLAHELTHTIQQGAVSQQDSDTVEEAPVEPSVEAEEATSEIAVQEEVLAEGPPDGEAEEEAIDADATLPEVPVEQELTLDIPPPAATSEEVVAPVTPVSMEGKSEEAMTSFTKGSASEVAATFPSLGTQLTGKINTEQKQEADNAPVLVAENSGKVEEGITPADELNASGDASISDGSTEGEPTKPSVEPHVNDGTGPNNQQGDKELEKSHEGGFLSWFKSNFSSFISAIKTKDEGVNTSAGPKQKVDQSGQANPNRATNQKSEAEASVGKQQTETNTVIQNNPGQQNIQPQQIREENAVEIKEEAVETIETQEDEHMANFRDMPLPQDVRDHSNKLLGPKLEGSLAKTRAETDAASKKRDDDKKTEISNAEQEQDRLNKESEAEQKNVVISNREKVATEQKAGIAEANTITQEFKTEANKEQEATSKEVSDKIATTESEADTELKKGEEKAEKKKKEKEKEAAVKKKELDKKKEKQGFWDRIASAIKSAVKAITKAIDFIFTALRDAVKGIIEAAKNLALKAIEAGRKWIVDKLNKFRDWAKNAVNKLLKDRFPGLAKRINAAIDATVDVAIAGVNKVAEGLKAGVNALAKALTAALDKILQVFQTALKAAVQIAGAVLTGDFVEALKIAIQAACDIAGIDSKPIFDFFEKAGQNLLNILKDPVKFFKNLTAGVGGGVRNFGKNIKQHLIKGLLGWLTGALSEAAITMPTSLDIKGIFSLTMQVLGLTYENIKERVIKRYPPAEKVFGAMEEGYTIIKDLVTRGPIALWERMKESLSSLKETVLGGIRDFVVVTVVKESITWLLGLLNPAGAIVKVMKLVWDLVKFLIERFQQIKDFISSVYNSIVAIASGQTGPAMKAVEEAMSRSLPVLISLLASLAGLGGIGATIKKIIGKVTKPINKALDKIIKKVIAKAKQLLGKGKAAAKSVKDKLVSWWKVKKGFKDPAGKSHTLYFKGSEKSAKLMVASEPQTFAQFIKSIKAKPGMEADKAKAVTIAGEIDKIKRRKTGGGSKADVKKRKLDKQADLKVELDKLGPLTAKLFGIEGDLPETRMDQEVVFTPKSADLGGRMQAKTLTKVGPAGSSPDLDNDIYEALMLRAEGGRSYYVRGHLLNEKMHGPGNQSRNLTPLSQKGNKLHLAKAETPVKKAVASGAVVRYTVTAVYGRGDLSTNDSALTKARVPTEKWEKIKKIRAAEQHVPKHLMLGADILTQDRKGKFSISKPLVSGKKVKNPVDTNLSNYELRTATKPKERVSISNDSLDKLAENTNGVDRTVLNVLQQAALKIGNLRRWDQIADKVQAQVAAGELDLSAKGLRFSSIVAGKDILKNKSPNVVLND